MICATSRRPAGALAFSLLLAASAAFAGPNPFRNTWNAPFAAITSGPQGAIVVERRPGEDAQAAAGRRIQEAIAAQHSIRDLRRVTQTAQRMKAGPRTGRPLDVRVPRMVVHTVNGRAVRPNLDAVRQVGGTVGDPTNALTFTFDGWTAAEQAQLEGYLANALPLARAVYGPPAFNLAVKVTRDDTLSDIQGGTYDAAANEIRMPELSGNQPEDTFVLLRLVLHAFHDDVALGFDSWELGMVWAAATVVHVSPGIAPGYDPVVPGPFYTASVYDPGNQPALGNSTFFGGSGWLKMLPFRIGQSWAAWYKCYVEDTQFFARFNTQYYAKLNSLPAGQRAALAGDTPALIETCEAVLPQVEGLPFFAWYRQQYALDTSVTVGPKLYMWNVPIPGDGFESLILIAEHFETQPDGSETPRGGTCYLTYFNYDFTLTLFAQEGNEITIPTTGDDAGEGFLIPTFFNIGGPQRVTVQADLNGLYARYPYPYGVRGDYGPGEDNLFGAVVGALDGTVTVNGLDGLTTTAEKGVWGGAVSPNTLTPVQLEISFEDTVGNQVSRTVNVVFDSYIVLMPAGTRAGLVKSLPKGPNGLYLFSVPLLPLAGDPALALGIPADQLLLARWKPNAPGGGEYEIYPDIQPMAPGRAYWLRLLADTTIAVDGLLPATTDDVSVLLFAGWNMVGCGRNHNVDVGELLVQRGAADSQPFEDAVTAGWVQAGVWGYSQQAGYELTDTLEPFGGYWLRCLVPEGATLVFPAAGTASADAGESVSRAGRSPFGKTDWQSALLLETAGGRSTATLGMAATARDGYDRRHDLQAPPAFGGQAALRFVHPNWGRQAGEYASDFRGRTAKGPWELQVTGVAEGVRARLRWPDLSQVPPRYRPILIDRATGREVYMRTASVHDFVSAGGTRDFAIELRTDPAGALAVTGLYALPAKQGVLIGYSLTADASVTARVLNLAGRPVRDLVANRPQTAGSATMLWDTRNAAGAPVPAGVYLIELLARAQDGQVARGVSQVSVLR
jgi:hypothetical protein